MNDEAARQGRSDTADLSPRLSAEMARRTCSQPRSARPGEATASSHAFRAPKPYTTNGFKDATRDEGLIEGWWRQWPEALIATPDTCTVDIEAPKPARTEAQTDLTGGSRGSG